MKKLLLTEDDTFEKAKIKILFSILIFSLTKILIALAVSWHFMQSFQLVRSIAMLLVYTILLKLLLASKIYIRAIAHTMVILGLLLIWSNIFVYAQYINIITTQFIFMLILSSFYLLNLRYAIIYASLSFLPVILFLIFGKSLLFSSIEPNELASPGYEIIVIVNFITIVFSHYLFREAFIGNIVEKEVLNLQLQQAVKDANKAAESKSDFLSTMSHELRTPLNSVIGISELLLADSYSPVQEENLNILKFSASNLHTLINDILDFNKLGSGKLDLELIPVDLSRLLNDVSKGLSFQATQKGVGFILDIDKSLTGHRVFIDPTRITQIVYNLAGNAIKFTEKGSVTISAKILSITEESISVQLSVLDTGIGINAEQQISIFEPFTQASSSTTRNFGGTGLGLAIVKRLLFLFNSSIRVESIPGRGSRFYFELTLKRDLEPENIKTAEDYKNYDLAGMKILVAEDNPMNRILITKVLSKWNTDVVFAVNGQEAVEMASSDEYDVILMDLHMPVMDGYEAARNIREMESNSNLPIIALTASVSGNLDEKIHASGMNDFVLKPFKLDELYKKLIEATLSKVKHQDND